MKAIKLKLMRTVLAIRKILFRKISAVGLIVLFPFSLPGLDFHYDYKDRYDSCLADNTEGPHNKSIQGMLKDIGNRILSEQSEVVSKNNVSDNDKDPFDIVESKTIPMDCDFIENTVDITFVDKCKQEPLSTGYKQAVTCADFKEQGYTINFSDISVIELLQFVSKISGINFVFDHNDLQFNVTIVSSDPTSVEDLSTILLQVLKMHDLKVVEQGNNVLIYRNPNISKLSTIVTDATSNKNCDSVVATRVFRLYTLTPTAAVGIIKPLLSADAIISPSETTRHIVISDLAGNIEKISDLLLALDSPGTTLDMIEYEVKYANPTSLVNYCQDVLGSMAEEDLFQVFSQPDTNKIFVISSPRLTGKALQLFKSLDVPEMARSIGEEHQQQVISSNSTSAKSNRFFMYKLKYQNGQTIAKSLQDIGYNLYVTSSLDDNFINTINSVQWVEVNNSVVVTGNQSNVDKVVTLLDGLDLPPKQVYIEVLILETSLESSWDFGVQWVALGDDQNKVAYASGLMNNAPTGSNLGATPGVVPNPGSMPLPMPNNLFGFNDFSNASSAFGLGIIGNVLSHKGKSFLTLGALLSALDQNGDTAIVLNPRIMSQDTQTAKFFVGQNIPYQTTSTIIQETGTVTQNIEYADVGVDLTVTATIAPNNVVSLQIEQTISELQSAVGTLTPTTNKTLASTRLQVPDGCFLVMSGHIRDKTTKIESGIPILSSIPILKHLFGRTVDQRQKRNIVMFIKPKVIASFDEGTVLTNKEGYRYNWESDKGSMGIAPRQAPECERPPVINNSSSGITEFSMD
ncbi:MAG: type II secretion system protein GspD [Victivallaceae bacterium]